MKASNDNGWRPIETAPKDGTAVLLGGCSPGPAIRIGWWGNGRYLSRTRGWERDWTTGADYGFAPTHWMPLPDPPAEGNAPTRTPDQSGYFDQPC
jgi:hypothetical protein